MESVQKGTTSIALKRALETRGARKALADALGIRQSTVSNWLTRERVSHTQVIAVEKATGVPRHELRPDLYPVEH